MHTAKSATKSRFRNASLGGWWGKKGKALPAKPVERRRYVVTAPFGLVASPEHFQLHGLTSITLWKSSLVVESVSRVGNVGNVAESLRELQRRDNLAGATSRGSKARALITIAEAFCLRDVQMDRLKGRSDPGGQLRGSAHLVSQLRIASLDACDDRCNRPDGIE